MSDFAAIRNFKRVVLKLSGEALRASGSHDNISPEIVERIAREIHEAKKVADVELAIVVGGGNFWRGASASARGMDRAGGPGDLGSAGQVRERAPARPVRSRRHRHPARMPTGH